MANQRRKHSKLIFMPHKHSQNYSSQDQTALHNELKTDTIHLFETHPKVSFRPQDIQDQLGIVDKNLRPVLHDILLELTEEGVVDKASDGTYKHHTIRPEPSGRAGLVGRVDHVNRKFAFVLPEDGGADVWVETDDLRGALDGDTVRIRLVSGRRAKRPEGIVEEVLSHARTEVVGTLRIERQYAELDPDHRKLYEPILIPLDKLGDAQAGDKVIVTIREWPTRTRKAMGEVKERLGPAGENETEMHAILAEFGLPYHFPEEVEQEAEAISERIADEEITRRRDLRAIPTFTIDPLDAKDFDDALSVRFLGEDLLEVGIHIADVSHYVRPGTELEKEAYRRATSVYLVDRTVPMLPEKLSNNLCSLRPNEDKLTFSAIFELTSKGTIVKEWFGRTIIHSDRRFTYEEAQEVLDTQSGDYVQELLQLNQLAHTLRKERFERGAINFETTEVRFRLDAHGKPLGIYKKERKDAHKLVEEFMLLANKRVAEHVVRKSKGSAPNAMVYRVHESPDTERLRTFSTFVQKLGFTLEVDDDKQIATSMNRMLAQVEGKPEQSLIEQLAVRTMAKARYTTEDLGHFGLAFRRYSHFTSPIRRYPDVMAHRILQQVLEGKAVGGIEALEQACKHSSERERLAAEAERASIKYKQIEYMSTMDDEQVFEGIITGVTDFGMFVEIGETASEGLVRMSDLNDDYYELDKENYRLVGERTQRIYAFGDVVRVKVKETNLARRSMDLALVDARPRATNARTTRTPSRKQSAAQKPKKSHRGSIPAPRAKRKRK